MQKFLSTTGNKVILIKAFISLILALGIYNIYFREPMIEQQLPATWEYLQLVFTIGAIAITLGNDRHNKRIGFHFLISGFAFICANGLFMLHIQYLAHFIHMIFFMLAFIGFLISFGFFSYALTSLSWNAVK